MNAPIVKADPLNMHPQVVRYAKLFAGMEGYKVWQEKDGKWSVGQHGYVFPLTYSTEDNAWSYVFDIMDCQL